MNNVEAFHERLAPIAERLSGIADGIGDQSGKAGPSGGGSTNFPAVPVGQSIAKEWNEIRSVTSQLVSLIGQATLDQGGGVQRVSHDYRATDIDNADGISRQGDRL